MFCLQLYIIWEDDRCPADPKVVFIHHGATVQEAHDRLMRDGSLMDWIGVPFDDTPPVSLDEIPKGPAKRIYVWLLSQRDTDPKTMVHGSFIDVVKGSFAEISFYIEEIAHESELPASRVPNGHRGLHGSDHCMFQDPHPTWGTRR